MGAAKKRGQESQVEITDFYRKGAKRRRRVNEKKSKQPAAQVSIENASDAWKPSEEPSSAGLLGILRQREEKRTNVLPGGLSSKLSTKLNESMGNYQQQPNVLKKVFDTVKPTKKRPQKKAEVKQIPKAHEQVVQTIDRTEHLSAPTGKLEFGNLDPLSYDRSLLPAKYEKLLHALDAIETANVVNRSRKQSRMRFLNIVDTVSRQTRSSFKKEDLAVIVSLIPEAFRLTRVRHKRSSQEGDIEIELLDPTGGSARIAQRLAPRRHLLHSRLLKKLHDAYDEFLQPLSTAEREQWKTRVAWHPKFDVETAPELGPATLKFDHDEDEDEPVNSSQTADSQTSLRSKFGAQTLQTCTAEEQPPSPDIGDSSSASPGQQVKLVPSSLLERVRSRQRKKQEREESGQDEMEKRCLNLSRLIITLDALRPIIGSKSRIELSALVDRLSRTHREAWTRDELQKQLWSLTEEVPTWASIDNVQSMGGRAVKIFKVNPKLVFKDVKALLLRSKELAAKPSK
ncbi:hypothetical protein NDN08_005682 [Rhodosorus marinus]|uniref:CDT1 Geminin-binding domain-containing protein n=1 Tax=Rhodosorus marinus TaxID=101924 RepID=A0AAV8V513_9RHOD|nr:hypothetical protein NDN08_005682 [Rhodosorus marinus]